MIFSLSKYLYSLLKFLIRYANDVYIPSGALCQGGGNEIASCVHKAFTSKLTCEKMLVMWSDNAAGRIKIRLLFFCGFT